MQSGGTTSDIYLVEILQDVFRVEIEDARTKAYKRYIVVSGIAGLIYLIYSIIPYNLYNL